MRLLGIDYGQKKIGLAIADGPLAEPLKTLREKIREIVRTLKIEKIVVGISEGEMGRESKKFSLSLSRSLRIPVGTFDETLTTVEAQRLSIEAKVKRKKRRELEDAYSATLILQDYLDFKDK